MIGGADGRRARARGARGRRARRLPGARAPRHARRPGLLYGTRELARRAGHPPDRLRPRRLRRLDARARAARSRTPPPTSRRSPTRSGSSASPRWGISGGGPHALACAALCDDRLTAAASLAAVAPWGAEGLDWLAGHGRREPRRVRPRARGRGRAAARVERDRAQLLASTPRSSRGLRDAARARRSRGAHRRRSPVLARGGTARLAQGVDGWIDDDLASSSPGASTSRRSPGRCWSCRAATTGSSRARTASGSRARARRRGVDRRRGRSPDAHRAPRPRGARVAAVAQLNSARRTRRCARGSSRPPTARASSARPPPRHAARRGAASSPARRSTSASPCSAA